MLRVMVVDDERLARKRLVSALAKLADVEVVAEAASGAQAITDIARFDPSVVLLDIEMPNGGGFDVITKMLERSPFPEVIFVTAFNSYAVEAYDHGAIDYLLKPFTVERLGDALRRARERIRLRTADEQAARLQHLVRSLQAEHSVNKPDSGLWFRQGNEQVRLFPRQIQYASADRDYVLLEAPPKKLYLRCTINSLAQRLGDDHFLRIHRSHIVRKASIRTLRRTGYGKAELELQDGTVLRVGASYLSKVSSYIADEMGG